jgi:hypothetical protein
MEPSDTVFITNRAVGRRWRQPQLLTHTVIHAHGAWALSADRDQMEMDLWVTCAEAAVRLDS